MDKPETEVSAPEQTKKLTRREAIKRIAAAVVAVNALTTVQSVFAAPSEWNPRSNELDRSFYRSDYCSSYTSQYTSMINYYASHTGSTRNCVNSYYSFWYYGANNYASYCDGYYTSTTNTYYSSNYTSSYTSSSC